MPHHRYDPEAIKRANETVEYCQKLIDNAKLIKLGEKEAIKNALEIVREMEFTSRTNVFSFLKRGSDQTDSLARFQLGLMEAYQNVLTLFEAPDKFVESYEQDKKQAQSFLEEAKVFEQVENG